MWKPIILLLVFAFVTAAIWLFFEVDEDRQRTSRFRNSWNTELVAVVDSLELITGDAGIIYFTIREIQGNQHDLRSYSGGSFYLLTHNGKGKLIEGGMRSIVRGDVIMITNQKNIAVIRNNREVIVQKIYFRNAIALWRNIDLDQVKNHWAW